MYQALILLPALVAMAMLNSSSAARVALRVYLPCMLIVPMYFSFNLGGMIVNVTTFLSLFLAVVGFYTWFGTLRFTLLDACLLLYTISAFPADAQRHDTKLGIYALLLFFSKCMCPYWIGRTLIEQSGLRRDFAKVLVICLTVIAVLSVWEYGTQQNLFQKYVERLLQTWVSWPRQTRWGFARIAGPYGHAIVAGMIFSTGLLLQFWLVGTKSWSSSKFLRFIRSGHKPLYITLIIALGLFMTQSRGPWIGCGFGIIVASIGFARDRRRAATIAISILAIGGAITYVTLDKYTAVDDSKTTDRDQLNASYRRELIATYTPLVEKGGLWGWGSPQPLSNGTAGYSTSQSSIDNEYILVAMWQGYAGFFLFVGMIVLTGIHLIRLCMRLRSREDILFAYCMLGCVLAMSFSASTVSLSDPMQQIWFLLMGWSISIQPTLTQEDRLAPVATGRFAFQRVFA